MQLEARRRQHRAQFPGARFDVIELAGEPIGCLSVDRRSDAIQLIDIALLPERRRMQIGGTLLRDLLDEAASSQRPVRLHVERSSPALRLYQRLGFAAVRDEGVYLLMEWAQAKTAS